MAKRFPPLRTPRFVIRVLGEGDVGDAYLGWFGDREAVRHIEAARTPQTVETLKSYVRAKRASAAALLLGIHARGSRRHIGNIKFEPIDRAARTAVMGVLIGDPAWRGKGVFPEVFEACAARLRRRERIRRFGLGVERRHQAALRTYAKSGFRRRANVAFLAPRRPGAVYMVAE